MDEDTNNNDPPATVEVNRNRPAALTESAASIAAQPSTQSGPRLHDTSISNAPAADVPFDTVDKDRGESPMNAALNLAPGDSLPVDCSSGVVSLDTFLASVERRAWLIARLSTRDDDAALDIVQDTMLRMFELYADKPSEERSALFFRILNNRITDHHRRRGFDRLVRRFGEHGDATRDTSDMPEAVDQLADDTAGPDVRANAEELGDTLRQALDSLPHRQRQVFLLRQWQGMSVAETAFALSISQGSVKTHLSRAMDAMRSRLRELEA